MTGVGRNSPCPCGSGKRFKDCHGSLDASGDPVTVPDAPWHSALEAALDAQKASRFADALVLYQEVLAAQPGHFDALHMLGVVHYQRGDFDVARRHVGEAAALRPFDRAVRQNLELIESALERRSVEREICRDLLPRLTHRCIRRGDADSPQTWAAQRLDLVVLAADTTEVSPELERVQGWLGAQQLIVWVEPGRSGKASLPQRHRTIDAARAFVPDASHVIFFGADKSPASWFGKSTATDVALYCRDEPAGVLIDRITELAREGQTPIQLLFSSERQSRRLGLPGVWVDAGR